MYKKKSKLTFFEDLHYTYTYFENRYLMQFFVIHALLGLTDGHLKRGMAFSVLRPPLPQLLGNRKGDELAVETGELRGSIRVM